jgi:DNA mismatch repair ATPase MutL
MFTKTVYTMIVSMLVVFAMVSSSIAKDLDVNDDKAGLSIAAALLDAVDGTSFRDGNEHPSSQSNSQTKTHGTKKTMESDHDDEAHDDDHNDKDSNNKNKNKNNTDKDHNNKKNKDNNKHMENKDMNNKNKDNNGKKSSAMSSNTKTTAPPRFASPSAAKVAGMGAVVPLCAIFITLGVVAVRLYLNRVEEEAEREFRRKSPVELEANEARYMGEGRRKDLGVV